MCSFFVWLASWTLPLIVGLLTDFFGMYFFPLYLCWFYFNKLCKWTNPDSLLGQFNMHLFFFIMFCLFFLFSPIVWYQMGNSLMLSLFFKKFCVDVEMGGEMNMAAGIQVAQLALKHRQNKNQQQRIIVFAGR